MSIIHIGIGGIDLITVELLETEITNGETITNDTGAYVIKFKTFHR